MGESSASIPTPDTNCIDWLLSVSGKKRGGKEEPNLLVSEIKLQCFALLPCCGKYSTASKPGFFFHCVAVKRKQHNCNPPWDAERLEKDKEWTTFTTTQTTKTQFKKETDQITY